MLGMIGRKIGMTQVFNEQGHQVPVTVVEAKPNPIVKVIKGERTKPGYRAIELGHGSQRVARASKKGEGKNPRGSRANKAEIQHAVKAGVTAVPVSAFYDQPQNAPRHLARFCFCKHEATLDSAIDRLRRHFRK